MYALKNPDPPRGKDIPCTHPPGSGGPQTDGQKKETMFRIATRGSDLALAQAEYIQNRLQALGYSTELKIVKTTGDVNLAPFALASGDERKGLFTKEIEDALLQNQADIAVHSYKDLPSVSVPELMIAAIPQRLDSRDYLICKKKDRVGDAFPYIRPDGRIGTSSVRRRSQLKHRIPTLQVEELRGNVPTRVRRLFEETGPDAILLSGAGIQRLIEQNRFVEPELLQQLDIIPVDIETLVPAPAQGTLAVQCRSADAEAREALQKLHDAELADILSVERGVLAALEGGCHLPLGIQAYRTDEAVEAHVYLGREFVKTRYPQTIQLRRRHSNPAILRDFLVSELTNPSIPIYVFGKQERMDTLEQSYDHIHCFGVIRTTHLLSELPELQNDSLIGCFSAEAIRLVDRLNPSLFARSGILWAVPGNRTASLLQERGVQKPQIIVGDGTGAGLARHLVNSFSERLKGLRIIGLSATGGREEFYQILAEAGFPAERLDAYITKPVMLESGLIASIPEQAYMLFGSPSSFHSFADSLKSAGGRWSDGWRICSIGQTTSAAIRQFARENNLPALKEPYMTADDPDYDRIIREILGL